GSDFYQTRLARNQCSWRRGHLCPGRLSVAFSRQSLVPGKVQNRSALDQPFQTRLVRDLRYPSPGAHAFVAIAVACPTVPAFNAATYSRARLSAAGPAKITT